MIGGVWNNLSSFLSYFPLPFDSVFMFSILISPLVSVFNSHFQCLIVKRKSKIGCALNIGDAWATENK